MNAPLPSVLPATTNHASWQASLALRIECRDGHSVLAERRHHGPLRVQKALYPEGDEVCQILVLHPPAGIAGGDRLDIDVQVGPAAHAQITTPGAGKWYRSAGPTATQDIRLDVAPAGILEWLPQEAIVFDEAQADSSITLTLAPGARCIGWDIVCLGRTASGERFRSGRFRQGLRLQRDDGTPLWRENIDLHGGSNAMQSAVALGGHTVFGTLWCAGIAPDAALLDALRAVAISDGLSGVSALPDVTAIRVVSHSGEAVRRHLEAAWAIARPALLQRQAMTPRIWRT